MLPQPGASRLLRVDDAGSSFSMPAKSRPLSAMSSMFSRVIRPDRAAGGRLHLHGLGLNGDGFGDAADLERDRAKGDALGRGQDDAFLLVGLEAAHRDGDVVLSGEQVREQERAVGRRSPFRGSGWCRRS